MKTLPLPRLWQWPARLLTGFLILAVRLYQITLGPLLAGCGAACRFHPSCSRYMIGALRKYGPVKGLLKGTARVLRCHPWHPGGYDPP